MSGGSRVQGQAGLFGMEAGAERFDTPKAQPWTAAERLRREFEAAGFFLSGHPLDDYAPVLKRMRVPRWAEFARSVKQGASAARLAATVLDRAERRTKSGNKMGIVTLSDPSGQYEAIIFQEGLNQYRDLLEKGSVVLVAVQANVEGEDVRARIVTACPRADPTLARARPPASCSERSRPAARRPTATRRARRRSSSPRACAARASASACPAARRA